MKRRQPGLSPWAVAAMLCSSAVFCAPLSLLGVILGVRALSDVRRVPGRRGGRLAMAAVIVGALSCGAWTAVALWWHANVRRPIIEGPHAGLVAGFAGDFTGFRRAFTGPAAAAPDSEIEAFCRGLRERYGDYAGLSEGEAAPQPWPILRNGAVRVPYRLRFAGGSADATAEFLVRDPSGGGLVLRFASILVLDRERGTLAFPAAAAAGAPEGDPD